MFEAIRSTWNNSTTSLSHKKQIGRGPTLTESLADLHDGACWTGVKVASERQVVTVTLKSHGSPLMTWSQPANTLEPLPFPFPSWMAKEMDLTLEVSVSGNSLISVIVVIHEINVPKNDRYLFVSEGVPLYHWNGASSKREFLAVKKLHIRVPSVSAILNGEDISVVCIHEWSETF